MLKEGCPKLYETLKDLLVRMSLPFRARFAYVVIKQERGMNPLAQ